MKKLLLSLLLIASVSFGQLTERVWDASADSDMSNADNWTGGSGAPSVTDSLVFDATTATDATASANIKVGAINALGTYSGAISYSGYTCTTTVSGIHVGHTGTINWGNSHCLDGGEQTFSTATGISTWTGVDCIFSYNGTDTISDLAGKGVFGRFKGVSIGEKNSLYKGDNTVSYLYGSTGPMLSMADSSILITTAGGYFRFQPIASMCVFDLGNGYSWTGSSNLVVEVSGGATTVNCTIPAVDYSSAGGSVTLSDNSGSRITNTVLTGNVNFGSKLVYLQTIGNNGTLTKNTIDFNGFDFTCGSLQPGSYGGDFGRVNFGSGSHIIANLNSTVINSARYIYDLGSSSITCGGNWLYASNDTIIVGTSEVNITNTATITTTNENPAFYDFVINAPTKTITHADTVNCEGDYTVTVGTALLVGKTLSCVDLTIAGTSTIVDTTSIIYISGDVAYGNSAVHPFGSGKYVLSSGVTHNWASGTGALRWDTVSVLGSTVFTGTDTLKLQMADDIKVSGGTHVLTAGYDIEGSDGSLDSLDNMTIDIPASDTVSYIYFNDITLAAGDTLWADGTCIDSGTNSENIIFYQALDTIPVIDSLSPARGAFGDSVIVHGSIFGGSPSIYVAGGLVPSYEADSVHISFVVTDLDTAGPVEVIVKNNAYNTFDTSTFTYDTIPVLTLINPDSGNFRYTQNDTLFAYGSLHIDSVYIGDSACVIAEQTSDFVRFTIPVFVDTVTVSVRTVADYGYRDTLENAYRAVNMDTIPSLISHAVNHSKLTGGFDTLVFDFATLIDSVYYGAQKATISGGNDSLKFITVPAGAKGIVSIISYALYGYVDSISAGWEYANIYGVALNPTSVSGGDTITASAEYGFLTTGLSIAVGDSAAVIIAGYSDTEALFIAPNYTSGKQNVTFTNNDADVYILSNGLGFGVGPNRFRFGFGFGF